MGRIEPEVFERAAAIAEKLFAAGAGARREAGPHPRRHQVRDGARDATGTIVVIDEIHTPDSSRYWYADDYEARLARGEEPRSLDKEYVRRWLASEAKWTGDGPPPTMPDDVRVEAARRYIASYELVTGKPFVPDTREPVARIAAALGARVIVIRRPRSTQRGTARRASSPRFSAVAPAVTSIEARWVHLVVADARPDGRRAHAARPDADLRPGRDARASEAARDRRDRSASSSRRASARCRRGRRRRPTSRTCAACPRPAHRARRPSTR